MKTLIFFGVFLISFLSVVLFSAFTPYITRKTESFGVGIPEELYDDPPIKKIRESYRNWVLGLGIGLTIIVIGLFSVKSGETGVMGLPVAVFLQIGVMFGFYLIGHRKMKTLKALGNWTADKQQMVVIDTGFRKKRVTVSPWWFLLYPVVILGTLGLGLALYHKMPDQIPFHYNINGEVDRWAVKSYKLLFFAPVVQVLITFLMGFLYWIISQAKQQVDPSMPEKSIEQNRIFRYQWSAFTIFAGLAMLLIFGLMQVLMTGLIENPVAVLLVSLVMIFGVVSAAFYISVTTGQGGSRISAGRNRSGGVINRDEDQYWKLGMFYYNPDDPALFVEKRFGVGWTNNFARPLSWVMIVGFIIILPLLIIGASMLLTK